MKIGLIGPGAIGSVIAGALVRRADVELVIGARTSFTRLVVAGVEPPIDEPVRVLLQPPERTRLDVVLLATKAHQTAAAAPWLEAWVGEETVLVVLQNGVEQAESVRAVASTAKVVPAVVSCPSRRAAPGHAELRGRAELIVPGDRGGQAVAELFRGSYLHVIATDDWVTAAWKKLLFNSAAGAVTTLTRRPTSVLRDPDARALTLALMHEAAAVARAEGADVPSAQVEEILELYLARTGDHVSSITADRLAGVPTEWQARNEVVVRKAAAHGLAVPLGAALATLLRLSEP